MATKVRSNFSESNYLSTAASKATTDKWCENTIF